MPWQDASPDLWVSAYQANVVSAVRMIHAFVPAMRERGWGRVVQVGGGLATQPIALQPQYSAALAARHNLAVSLARELKGTGVTSNVVSPMDGAQFAAHNGNAPVLPAAARGDARELVFHLAAVKWSIGTLRAVVELGIREVPPGFDAYLAKRSLQNWEDLDAVRVLARVREAIGDDRDARLWIENHLLARSGVPDTGKLSDIEIMAILGGRERGWEDWTGLGLKRVSRRSENRARGASRC